MRRLLVMRHAKSAWDTDAPNDHARPLNERGRRAAPAVAAALAARGWIPGWLLSSDAARARETAELLRAAWPEAPAVHLVPTLYLAGVDELRAALQGVPDEVTTVLAVGHNPGWEDVVEFGAGIDLALKTADVAVLETDAPSWTEVLSAPRRFDLVDRVRARAVTRGAIDSD